MTEEIHMSEAQQIELAMSMLDNAGIPRTEGDRELSLVARVSRLANPWQPVETAPKEGQWVLVYDVRGPSLQWHPHWIPISQGDTMSETCQPRKPD